MDINIFLCRKFHQKTKVSKKLSPETNYVSWYPLHFCTMNTIKLEPYRGSEKYHFSFLIFMLVLFNKMNGNQTASIARSPSPPLRLFFFFFTTIHICVRSKNTPFSIYSWAFVQNTLLEFPRSDGYEIRPVLGKVVLSAQQSDRVFNKLPLLIRKVS